MFAQKHPFTGLVARCVLAALGTGTVAAVLLALAVLLLAGE